MHVVMHINDVNAGRAYYTNPDTGHTTWEIPPCTEKGFALIPLRPVVHAAAAGSYTGSEDKENVSGVDTMQQLDSGKKRGRAPDAASHTAADRLALATELHQEICERNKAARDLPLAQKAKELHALTLLSHKLDTMTAMLHSPEAADWHMLVDRASDVSYANVRTGASQCLPPIVEGGFNLVPLHQPKETSDPGSNEERAGGNSAAQTYGSDKKCKVATPTASELAVQASELHEQIHTRVIAVSHMDPGEQAQEVLEIQEMIKKFDAMAAQLYEGIGQA